MWPRGASCDNNETVGERKDDYEFQKRQEFLVGMDPGTAKGECAYLLVNVMHGYRYPRLLYHFDRMFTIFEKKLARDGRYILF
jgi:hypothetical protein